MRGPLCFGPRMRHGIDNQGLAEFPPWPLRRTRVNRVRYPAPYRPGARQWNARVAKAFGGGETVLTSKPSTGTRPRSQPLGPVFGAKQSLCNIHNAP